MDSISSKCKTPGICTQTEPAISLCINCEDALVEATNKAIQNMGIPDRVGCGECGQWFQSPSDFLEHFQTNHVNS